jgi:hypothetical protein
MSDLDLIRDLAPDIPLPGPAELAAARSRLAAAIAGEHGSRAVRPARWRGWLALAGTAAAAAGLLIVTVAPGSHPSRPSGAATRAARVNIGTTAASVLRRAALAALRLPTGTPRPDQFVYVEWANGVRTRQLYQAWLSVDGTHDGLVRSGGRSSVQPGCRHGHQAGRHSYSCVPAPDFLPGMPATPRGVLRYLQKTHDVRLGTGTDGLDRLGVAVHSLLGFTYLLPQQRAALYELLAQTPGFTVVPHAADVTGRQGIGVSWPLPRGGKAIIIFDRRTYAELGLRTRGSGKYRHYESGQAVLKIAIVSKVGQLP